MLFSPTTTTAATLVTAMLLATAAGVPEPRHRRLQHRDRQFEDTLTTSIDWGKYVRPSITTHETSVDGRHTTYSLELTPVGEAETIYALYGHEQVPLEMPPAYQVATPFGTNFGGTPSQLVAIRPDAQFDSFLFASASSHKLGSAGIDFDSWTSDVSLSCNDGAVFYADPYDAPAGPIVAAQLTVPTGSVFTAQLGVQGHKAIDPAFQRTLVDDPAVRDISRTRESWNQEYVQFSMAGPSMPAGH